MPDLRDGPAGVHEADLCADEKDVVDQWMPPPVYNEGPGRGTFKAPKLCWQALDWPQCIVDEERRGRHQMKG